MVASAKKEHKSVMDIAKFYTDAFFKDFDMLNCRMPDVVSPATDNIDEYIKIITKLLMMVMLMKPEVMFTLM